MERAALQVSEYGNLAEINFGAVEQGAFCSHGEGDVAASDGEQFHFFLQVEETHHSRSEPDDAVLADADPATAANSAAATLAWFGIVGVAALSFSPFVPRSESKNGPEPRSVSK